MSTEASPYRRTTDELNVLAALLDPPPWRLHSDSEDRGIRAAFRRWAPAEGAPGLDLLAPVWMRLDDLEIYRKKQGWGRLVPVTWSDQDIEEVVRRTAMLLHLAALQPDKGHPVDNFGAACRAANLANGRFSRLVNPPPNLTRRLQALSRAFRRFRQQNIHLRLIAEAEKPEARLAELRAFHTFLFTDDPARAVSRWARGYFWPPVESTEFTPH